MDNTLVVFACIALGAAAVLFAVIAVAAVRSINEVRRISQSIAQVGADVTELKAHMVPLLHEATNVLRKSEHTLDKLDSNIESMGRGVKAFEQIATDVRSLEQDLLLQVREPLADVADVVSGTISKVTGFIKSALNL